MIAQGAVKRRMPRGSSKWCAKKIPGLREGVRGFLLLLGCLLGQQCVDLFHYLEGVGDVDDIRLATRPATVGIE